MFYKFWLILKVIPKLGIWNFFYVIYYTISIRLGLRKKKFPISTFQVADFFIENQSNRSNAKDCSLSEIESLTIVEGNLILEGTYRYYSLHSFSLGEIPSWTYDPFSGKFLHDNSKHWLDIKEFDLTTGDIKNLWELSRFDFLVPLAKSYVLSCDKEYLFRINELLKDWCLKNPYNIGVHWKCGQEVAIRVFKLFDVSVYLKSITNMSDSLINFILNSLQRIDSNINYALAQNNNHGTSESAALYIGATWLLNQEKENQLIAQKAIFLNKIQKKGRIIFVERLNSLILPDGTFSQKSVTYHRMVMDTISYVLYSIEVFCEPALDTSVRDKLGKFEAWLLEFISNEHGGVPNLGPNDGAMLENIGICEYRDFRPSIQLFRALLTREYYWDNDNLMESILWRGIDVSLLKKKDFFPSHNFIKDKEFIKLGNADIQGYLIAKQGNFRPSNDVLHLDLWYKGHNILFDSGSYSYNSNLSNYFRSISSHNTLQFGSGEPMPRISRFLNGQWISVKHKNSLKLDMNQVGWEGYYYDYLGNYHKRKIIFDKNSFVFEVHDFYRSNQKDADVKINFNLISNHEKYVDISCCTGNGVPLVGTMEVGWQSLYYMEKSKCDRLSFSSFDNEGVFITRFNFK